jgi:anti-sigma-K factor RskA
MTHDEIRLSVPAFALGALDSDEHAEVAAHLATCAECAAALVEEERVVANIGLEATPVTPPIALKSRVLARIAAEPRQTESRVVPLPATVRARPPWIGGLLLAASVGLALGASLYAYALRDEVMALRGAVAAASDQSARLRQELATMRRDWVTLTRAMDVMKAPDLLRVDLKGQPQAPGATGRALWSQGAGLVFTAEQLPALLPGRVYQLWAITGTTPTSSGTFTPNATGGASVTVPVTAGTARPDAIGVTIEPTGGSATPTMPIVLLGSAGR